MMVELTDTSQPSTSADFERGEPPQKRRLYVEEVSKLWNLVKIYKDLGTREKCLHFAEEQGMIPKTKICSRHRIPMILELSTNETVGSWKCNKGPCRKKSRVSRGKGTFFENAKITMTEIFYLLYAYASKWSYDAIIKEDFTKEENCLSRSTISDWFNYSREAVVIYTMDKQEHIGQIGGPGKIVQIDESKFGKRKYNKGRHIEGSWVLGMVEDGSEDIRLEVCPNNVRSAAVLIPLILKHVAPGTTIHTDFRRAYDGLEDYGYIHHKVNHSDPENPFVASDGTHTQRIESQWRVVKRFFAFDNYNHDNFTDLIFEYMWRREIVKHKKDPFLEIIKVINYVYK